MEKNESASMMKIVNENDEKEGEGEDPHVSTSGVGHVDKEKSESAIEKKDIDDDDYVDHGQKLSELIGGGYVERMEENQELQRTYSNVISEFEGNSSVERIMEEYKKLYESLKASYSIQRKLVFENMSLRCDIKTNAEKVHLALHVAQEDKEIINNLTKQANQAWREADLLEEKEARARGVIYKLQDEISHLTSLVEDGSGIQELHTVAHLAVSERKELEDALFHLKSDLEFKDVKIQELLERIAVKEESSKRDQSFMAANMKSSEKKIAEYQKKAQEMEDNLKMLERNRANLTSDNTTLTLDLENLRARQLKMEKDEVDLRMELSRMTHQHTEQWELNIDKTKEITKLNTDLDIYKKRLHHMHQQNTSLKERLDDKDNNIKSCERHLKKKEAKVDCMERKFEQTSQTVKALQNVLTQREEKLKLERENVNSLSRTLQDLQMGMRKIQIQADEAKRRAAHEKEMNLNLAIEKDHLIKAVALADKNYVAMVKELNAMNQQLNKAVEQVAVMESDKERLYGRINTVLEMVNTLAADNENKEAKLLMLLKVNNEQETHINHINTKLFRMTNQRDNISNELHLIQLKNDELNLANHNLGKQSSALAEDLHNKEYELEKSVAANSTLKNEIRQLEINVIQSQEENNKKKVKIDDLELMIRNLDVLLCQKEKEIGKLRLLLDQMVHQRNLLGFQCLKKKEQIHLLMEKNTIMHDIFRSGNRAFNLQSKKIADMEIDLKNLFRQKKYLMSRIENVDNYKSKLGLANQQLVGALARSLAMEGEHPFNLHRWRHLKAVDISQYEMVIKVQYLLKRCIFKTDEVTRLETVIAEKTAIVGEMRRVLARRPGMSLMAKAKADQKAKEEISRKLKAAIAERNMNSAKLETQVGKTRTVVERLTDERKKRIDLNVKNQKLMNKITKLPAIGRQTPVIKPVVSKK